MTELEFPQKMRLVPRCYFSAAGLLALQGCNWHNAATCEAMPYLTKGKCVTTENKGSDPGCWSSKPCFQTQSVMLLGILLVFTKPRGKFIETTRT